MADSAIRADLLKSLDRLAAIAAEVALDLEVVDVVAKLGDLFVREVANLLLGIELERLA